MISSSKPTPINILVLNETIRQHLLDILKRNQFKPVVIANPGELAAELKDPTSSVIFIDYEAETQYGPAMIMNIKAASKKGALFFFMIKTTAILSGK